MATNEYKLILYKTVPYMLLIVTLYVIIIVSMVNWNFMPDDGYRYLHVVSNLLEGLGVRWNAIDAEPSQSFTSFPWILMLAGSAKIFDVSLINLSKYFGLISICLSVVFLFAYTIRYSDKKIISSVFLSLALITSPVIFFHSVNGMETMLFMLFLTCSVIGFFISLNDKKFLTITLIAFLITVLIRYESVIFCGLLSLYLMYKHKTELVFFLKRFFVFLILPGVMYFCFVYLYFGNFLPNSFYVKTAITLISPSGFEYFLENYTKFFLGCSIAFLFAYPFSKDKNKQAYLVIFFALHLQLLFILRIIPTVGQGGRFMYPYIVPLYLMTVNLTLTVILEKYSNHDVINRTLKYLVVFLLIYSTYSSNRKYDFKELIAYSSERVMDPSIGKSLAQIHPPKPSDISIVGGESGAISYFSKFTFVDIWGLHDSFIARNGLDNNYIYSYRPDIFISFIHNDTLNFDSKGIYEGLDIQSMLSKIENYKKHNDVKGNTAYFSYLVMTDERFSELKFSRKIEIGSGKSWVFFINENSPYSKKLNKVVKQINWANDKNIITASMRPKKILGALLNPFDKNNFLKADIIFDE